MCSNRSGGMGVIVTTGNGKTAGRGGREKAKQGETLKAGLFNKRSPASPSEEYPAIDLSGNAFPNKLASGRHLFSRLVRRCKRPR